MVSSLRKPRVRLCGIRDFQAVRYGSLDAVEMNISASGVPRPWKHIEQKMGRSCGAFGSWPVVPGTTARNIRIGVGGESNDRVPGVRHDIHLDSATDRGTLQLGVKMVLPTDARETQSEATSRQQKFPKTLEFLRNLRDSNFDTLIHPTCLLISYGYLPAHSQLKAYPHFARSLVQPLTPTISTVDSPCDNHGESCNCDDIICKGREQ